MDICIPDASTSTGHNKKGAGGSLQKCLGYLLSYKRKCHPETIKTFNLRGFFNSTLITDQPNQMVTTQHFLSYFELEISQ